MVIISKPVSPLENPFSKYAKHEARRWRGIAKDAKCRRIPERSKNIDRPPAFLGSGAVLKVIGRHSRDHLAGRYTKSRRLMDDVVILDEVLGKGMSGEVRLGHYRDACDEFVAIKQLSTANLSAGKRREIANEVELTLSVDHPHIVRLHRVYETADLLHLVLENLSGGELWERVSKQGCFGEDDASLLMFQMLSAVSYLHLNGIAHCDLKLENFLFEARDSNHLKLVDFGLAQRCDRSERLTSACGSRFYAAPEVLAGNYNEFADCWSMGIILYVLLTGVMPWRGSDAEVSRRIKAGEPYFHPPLWNPVSPAAKELVELLLELDSASRPSAQDALKHPWISSRKPSVVAKRRTCEHLLAFGSDPPERLQLAYLSLAAWALPRSQQVSLRSCFAALDQDGDGVLSARDLAMALDIDVVEAGHMALALDVNADNKVTFNDFLAVSLQGRQTDMLDMWARCDTLNRFDDYHAPALLADEAALSIDALTWTQERFADWLEVSPVKLCKPEISMSSEVSTAACSTDVVEIVAEFYTETVNFETSFSPRVVSCDADKIHNSVVETLHPSRDAKQSRGLFSSWFNSVINAWNPDSVVGTMNLIGAH